MQQIEGLRYCEGVRRAGRLFKEALHGVGERLEDRLNRSLPGYLDEEQANLAYSDALSVMYAGSRADTIIFADHHELRSWCLRQAPASGALFEFGVYQGKSINFFARELVARGDSREIVGFDSFGGFSEDWAGMESQYPRDVFDVGGALPQVEGNVRLVPGFIEETLPEFIKHSNVDCVAFAHIDTDTYSPASVALKQLSPLLAPGSILLFDELLGYPKWRENEWRALQETIDPSSYEFVGFAKSHRRARIIKAAIRITGRSLVDA